MTMEQLKSDLEVSLASEQSKQSNYGASFARLDEVAKSTDAPERLQHYLSKRSYVKALAWMEDPQARTMYE